MKKVLFGILVLFVCAITAAQEKTKSLPANATMALIEQNLLLGLASDNTGLRISCAYRLGDLKSNKAVIPLMSLLHNSDDFKLKTAVAWALCNIGDARGTFAVKQAVRFNGCCKTRCVCAWYYEHMVKAGTFIFHDAPPPMIAQESK